MVTECAKRQADLGCPVGGIDGYRAAAARIAVVCRAGRSAPLLSAWPLPRLCLLGGAKYRGITVVIMVTSCAKATIMVAECAKSGHQVGSVMHPVMVTTQASRVAA